MRTMEDKGKVRVRFMEVEIEAGNEALLQGIRSITSTIPTRVLVKTAAARPGLGSSQTAASPDPDSDPDAEEPAEEEVAAPEPERERQSLPRLARPRAAKTPEVLANLNLDADPMPLRAFCEGTSISKESNDCDKALVVAMWLKLHRSITGIGRSHIYTCFSFMGWNPPGDLTTPLRAMKKAKKRLMESAGTGLYAPTVLGENRFRELNRAP